jgi:hypothetical protein
MTAVTPGYSGKPLAMKLGIGPGTRLFTIGAPAEYPSWLGPLPGATAERRMSAKVNIVHLFVTRRAELEKHLARLRPVMRPDAAVWVSWPKKSAGVLTDVTEDTIRLVALPMGLVDVKVCAVSEVWSGLKLVIRTELR